jgi:demethylmenaquinone methyltransferase/2-methoxy-6-polyprenyl-1,4-benzoquinol methylase
MRLPHYDPNVTAPSSLETAFESPDAKRRHVRQLFRAIADRYDLITRLLSWGQDRRWKVRLLDQLGVWKGARVLDLACGTGDLVFGAVERGAEATGLDITPRMVELAAAKPTLHPMKMTWVVGDMTALPVRTAAYDLVTTGYGLRNVPDLPKALAEIHRVLKPGGFAGSLDFNRPDAAWLRGVYFAYLRAVGAALGWVLHRDPDTYRYIPASIARYPGAAGVATLFRECGFSDVKVVPVLGGLMAIHIARK